MPGSSSTGTVLPSGRVYGVLLRALVPMRVALSSRSGWSASTIWASMPPNDMPTTCARPTPSPSSTAITSSARSAIRYGCSSKGQVERPVSRWS